jgi:phosphoglycolate phosphatase
VIGDSMHDIHMGHNAGAISIGVTSGGHSREELEAAEIVLDDISELPQLFGL